MISILVFWIGDEIKLQAIKAKFNKLLIDHNVAIIYGPSEVEHVFLYNQNKYYKSCYDHKKYAFCADVWRVYKACNIDNVLYIDALTTINYEKFAEFLRLTSKYNLIIQYESKFFFANFLFFSKKKNNKVFLECYKKYQKTKNIKSIKSGPSLMSKYIYKCYGYGIGNSIGNEIFALHPREFSVYNSSAFFQYGGEGSWNSGSKNKTIEYFRTMELTFDEKESNCTIAFKRFLIIFFTGRWTSWIIYNRFVKKLYYSLLYSRKHKHL